MEAKPIAGTERGSFPFFSPDGRWIGFHQDDKLKKVPTSGGAPADLCVVGGGLGQASWSTDGTIVFTPRSLSGLLRVSADGGTPHPLTELDASRHETSHRYPDVLAGGQAVIFTVKPDDIVSWDDARIEVFSLRTGQRSTLITGGARARYVAPGYLVYYRRGSLWAVSFDPVRLKVTGPPSQVLEGVSSEVTFGDAHFSVSPDGSLAYVPGRPRGTDRRLVRIDRSGKREPLTDLRRAFRALRLSPDGHRLALQITGPNEQIWVYDLERGTLTPLTLRWDNMEPIWTPDGRRITFASNRVGLRQHLFWQPADGSGPAEQLTTNDTRFPSALGWSPDGKSLIFTDGPDVRILQPDGDDESRPFLMGPPETYGWVFSPNGRWLAYTSFESGRLEVYVPIPRLRESMDRFDGRWLHAGVGQERPRALLSENRIMAVAVTTDATFSASKPKLLFEVNEPPEEADLHFAVTPAGEFLMIEAGESEAPPAQINVVLNWAQELKQRLAAH
jgi:WD40 repeat protein